MGAITGITESSNAPVGAPYYALIVGAFSSSNSISGTQYTFYATVKFAAQ